MPRAIDLKQPTPDYDPTRSGTEFHIADLLKNLKELIQSILDGMLENLLPLLIDALEELTGLDLSGIKPLLDQLHLDLSSPEAFFMSLINALTVLPQVVVALATSLISGGLLGTDTPLNALNLFNIVPQQLLGFIPVSHIGEGSPNLLVNPKFEGAESVQGGGVWFWDDAVGNTTPGSVYTLASGLVKQLASNDIPVAVDQQLNASIYAMWSGLAYTGVPIKVQILKKLNGVSIGVDDLAAPTSPATNQATWVKIGSDYTVPSGCDAICLQLTITATATAGTVRFDDGDMHKTGLLQIPWVDGLPTELQDLVAGIQGVIDSIVKTFLGTTGSDFSLDDLVTSLQNIPFLNVLGVGGPADLGGSMTSTWNQLIGGLVGKPGTTAGLSDLFNIGYQISSWASLGQMGWDILGIRNNKPIDQGLLATSNSNFSLGRVAMQSSAPTIPVTQSVSAIGFLRMAEANDKGIVSWLGSGNANITACFVNIWKMNPTTGDMTLVHRSPNIVGNLSSSMTWVIYDYSATPILTLGGELYGIEITIQGTGTHTIAGTTTWIPPHPNAFPKTYAATRNSGTGTPSLGTVIINNNVGYTTNIPWIEWGITTGAGSTVHGDQTTRFDVVGATTAPVPSWANFIDIIAVGAGGGGAPGGAFGISGGDGGGAGRWTTGTWARGTDFTGAGTIINLTVPAGGDKGTISDDATSGGNTLVSIPGRSITAVGGAGEGSSGDDGDGAGNQVYRGITYVGGGPQHSNGNDGAAPGGGGCSGSDAVGGSGGKGARGAIWIVFRQT